VHLVWIDTLLAGIEYKLIKGDIQGRIVSITADSRTVVTGSAFVAKAGAQTDGHAYISQAVERGATLIVFDNPNFQIPVSDESSSTSSSVTYIQVPNAAKALALMAANFYGRPAEKLIIIGTTGTNGKTTITTLLYQLFTSMGYRAAMISTVEIRIAETVIPTQHTTPDALVLHQLFAQMAAVRVTHVFMEVSSHALAQARVHGINFSGAVFTNLSHEHLDYHLNFANYLKAKKILFDELRENAFALTNIDDKNGRIMIQNTRARRLSYSFYSPASNYSGRIIEKRLDGLLIEIEQEQVWFRLSGIFNAYNLLAVYAVAKELNLPGKEVLIQMSALTGPPGRMETVYFPGPITAIIDYAHSPDALENVINNIQSLRDRRGQLIVVVGCGGNRDTNKRPMMGKIASEAANLCIFTSDNPRNESPESIIEAMLTGVAPDKKKKVLTIPDRRQAIETAAKLAKPHDVILIAGKGHETYQEINGVRLPFNDKTEIQQAFEQLS
jgi:UDP-N-acetylmuramoyl-L-alanyl-D-glutamate--2,6-diaminopimelate ligase